MNPANPSNALAGETSPYLLQHAHNPVAWQPWGPAALARARATDTPILLSIGYSACHWCHVMAHESFEDAETAAVMNAHFINVKVDREERPDLDKIYQTAHALLTRRNGGWPLTVFLAADTLAPFYAGTYFPPAARHGLPGFKELLRWAANLYRERREDIRLQGDSLRTALAEIQALPNAAPAAIDDTPIAEARHYAADAYDPRHGGFGRAPKFPHPTSIERLLRDYARSRRRGGAGDTAARDMALHTLRCMARGGIYDQLGGGFCRYSTDAHWLIPHFEKMLYDNGPLLALYAQAWQVDPEPLFHRTALGTADWMLAEMQVPTGGLCSSIDADSEGHEGRYYVWSRAEIDSLLPAPLHAASRLYFGFDGPANFEGQWHPHVAREIADVAEHLGLDEGACTSAVEAGRRLLREARATRVAPARDDKILTAWNALALRGLAIAGRVFARTDYLDAAGRALDFIRTRLWRDGRLLATCRDGHAHLNAYLDDYALLLDASLELLQARWDSTTCAFASALADALLTHFQDTQHGGFYFTAHDHEALLQRTKTYADDALPNGNGVAAYALQRLGHLLGEPRYLIAAERTLRAGWMAVERQPAAHDAMLTALEEFLDPPETVIIRGRGAALQTWLERAQRHYAPHRCVLAIPADATGLPAPLAVRTAAHETIAYCCRGQVCDAPIVGFEAFETRMAATEVAAADPDRGQPRP